MISQADLETELRAILDKTRRIRPAYGSNPHVFHEDKAGVAESLLGLLDRVRGVAPRTATKITAAEIRDAARKPRHEPTAAARAAALFRS